MWRIGVRAMGIENKLIIEQQQNGDRLNYVVSQSPTPTSSGGSFPVLCFLHGIHEAASREFGIREQLSKHGPLRSESSLKATSRQFIVVAPQLPSEDDFWYEYAPTVKQIVTKVQENYGGDPKRTYLTGFSIGGRGVFDIALAQPRFWAALWSVDPSYKNPTEVSQVDNSVWRNPVWLSLGRNSKNELSKFREVLGLQPEANNPQGDNFYRHRGKGCVCVGDFVYEYRGKGSVCVEYRGMPHGCTGTCAYQDSRVYDWLLTHHK
jgi:hypothetical protein